MSRTQLPPELTTAIAGMKRRITDLERALNRKTPTPVHEPCVFSFDGALVASISPRWYNQSGRTLGRWVAVLVTAGSTDTVLHILVNGTSELAITIPAGYDRITSATLLDVHPEHDVVQVEIVTAGTDASGLTVQAVAT